MYIICTQFSLKHNALEIYVSGCKGHCEGCFSPETWDFNQGTDYYDMIPIIKNKILEYPNMIKRVWILGGEPLDQNFVHLKQLMEEINKLKIETWLFTSYELEQINDFFLIEFDYVKTGKYDKNKLGSNIQYGIELASTNQKIIKLKRSK